MFEQSVSVVIPTYNRAHLIERAIKSVLAQTVTSLEVIVVDDCSIDNTADVVNSISDDRIIYIQLQNNSGANVARNIGVQHAKYNLVAFQDSDDIWHRNKLETQIDFLINHDLDIVASRYNQYIHDNFNAIIPPMMVDSKDLATIELTQNVMSTQTILGKRQCFLNEPFDISFPRLQDWELAIRLTSRYKCGYLNKPLVDVYLQADSISSNPEKLFEAYKMLLEKHHDLYKYEALKYEAISITAYKAAVLAKKNGKKLLYSAYEKNKSIKIIIYIFIDFMNMAGSLIYLNRRIRLLRCSIK
ncbi:glycosyltransferase family 2 protein [Aeromonas sp. Y293-4]|uniref:glycosyltransferase family 2 protein n=1 Tax=Aeromonas sp. Y293-4 TaxID=2990504 RepID=UPI0022E37E98|nr:glycosyltransferase family 2 protein [Aeromonas sp. Y293-4]